MLDPELPFGLTPAQWAIALLVGAYVLLFFAALAVTFGTARFGRRGRVRRSPGALVGLPGVVISIGLALASYSYAPSDQRRRDALVPIAGGGVFLAFLLAAPLLHRRSGFRPLELRVTARGAGRDRDSILQDLENHLSGVGMELLDAGRLHCDLAAAPARTGFLYHPSLNAGSLRVYINAEDAGRDLLLEITVDVRAWITHDTWESAVVGAVADGLARRVREVLPNVQIQAVFGGE